MCYDRDVNSSNTGDGEKQAYFERRAEMLRLLERHLQTGGTSSLAEQACVSRYHFHREFRRVMEEAPGEMERRLRLERAAAALRATSKEIIEIGWEAGYESLEGFSRAFRRAYGLPPSRYRKQSAVSAALPGRSAVHYNAKTQNLWVTTRQGEVIMDLTDRLIENDYFAKKGFLEAARVLTDVQLDAPLVFRHNLVPFAEPERTLREALSRMTGDGWAIGMMEAAHWPSADASYRQNANQTIPEMLFRLDGFHQDYSGFVHKVKREDLWDTEWLDSDCEPVETFTYGTTIEATLTWGIAQRMVVQRLLEQLGLPWHP